MKEQTETRIWKDVVLDALIQLGGQAHVSEITKIALKDPKAVNNQHVAKKVQQVVGTYSVFETVEEGTGIYRIVETALPSPVPADLKLTVPPIVSVAPYSVTDEIQGMLLSIGKIYGYGVYAPANDRTMRKFNGEPLGALTDISTNLTSIVGPSKSAVVQRIDVLWFEEDEIDVYPAVGFEVEHTTPIHTGLNRLAEIPRRFKSKLYIVGDDEKDRNLFDNLLKQNVYQPLNTRIKFQTFDDVRSLYQNATAFDKARRDNEKAMHLFGIIQK
jgi:hypothetical protein